MSAILDNTLNFTAGITKDRDKIAYHKLEEITYDYNYAEKYFKEVQENIDNIEDDVESEVKSKKNVMDGIKTKLSDAKGAAQESFSKVKTSAKGSIDKIKSKVKAKNQ